MQRKRILLLVTIAIATIAIAAAGATRAFADDPCLGFKWDVRKEHALFGGTPVALSAGKALPTAPTIVAGRLYALQLAPQTAVSFAVAPGKGSAPDGSYAGLAVLHLETAGDYRVSVDAPVWIDVAADGTLAEVEDYQGLHSCDAPHKIVEFKLAGGSRFVLQLSGAPKAAIRLTVTPAPPKT
jgi:hypothetical protein